MKWIATVVQLAGNSLTGPGVTSWNIRAFFVGIVLWFAVGAMWKDKAIMIVRPGAFLSLLLAF